MVNETNKAQDTLENEELGQRLAASNQALADMQAEHRQLLEEMEQLRRRAEELQRLREQQEREEEERKLQYQQSVTAAAETLEPKEESENFTKAEETARQENVEKEEDPEEADYIKEKLAEIARLKAQFKRVQHMINTTELIENHISKNEAKETKSEKEVATKPKPAAKPASAVTAITANTVPTIPATVISHPVATTPMEQLTMPNMPTMADLDAATTSDEKEQLILTMLNMFQDFSTDLKSQADNLRAERERIKELKESIIKARKEPPK